MTESTQYKCLSSLDWSSCIRPFAFCFD